MIHTIKRHRGILSNPLSNHKYTVCMYACIYVSTSPIELDWNCLHILQFQGCYKTCQPSSQECDLKWTHHVKLQWRQQQKRNGLTMEAVYQASRVFWHYAGYSWDNVHEMEELCRRLKHPVTFPVRASLMAQSLPQLSWLLQQSDRWSLTRKLSSDDVFRTRFYWNLLSFFLLKML